MMQHGSFIIQSASDPEVHFPNFESGVQAISDFKERIRNYEEVYETITDRNLHYIKLIDMCDLHHLLCSYCTACLIVIHLLWDLAGSCPHHA